MTGVEAIAVFCVILILIVVSAVDMTGRARAEAVVADLRSELANTKRELSGTRKRLLDEGDRALEYQQLADMNGKGWLQERANVARLTDDMRVIHAALFKQQRIAKELTESAAKALGRKG